MSKRPYHKQGSSFFVMMLFLMIMTMTLYTFIRMSAYGMSLAIEREKSEKQYYLAYSLYCFIQDKHQEQCATTEHKRVVFEGPWPYNDSSVYNGKVWVTVKKDIKTLFVSLSQRTKQLITLSFII
jgi:hypothetical protein